MHLYWIRHSLRIFQAYPCMLQYIILSCVYTHFSPSICMCATLNILNIFYIYMYRLQAFQHRALAKHDMIAIISRNVLPFGEMILITVFFLSAYYGNNPINMPLCASTGMYRHIYGVSNIVLLYFSKSTSIFSVWCILYQQDSFESAE